MINDIRHTIPEIVLTTQDFHPCCPKLTEALLRGRELSITEMLGLLDDNKHDEL